MTRKRTAEELIEATQEMAEKEEAKVEGKLEEGYYDEEEKIKGSKKGKYMSSREIKKAAKAAFKKEKAAKKKSKSRQVATKRLLGVVGVMAGAQQTGPGRPRGSFKHGMPIHKYRALQRNKKLLESRYRQAQDSKLRRRGLDPEQVRQLQMRRTLQEPQQQNGMVQQQARQQLRMSPKEIQRENRRRDTRQAIGLADDELNFRRWSADNTVSPNTQRMLTEIRRIQNKGQRDNIEQQRRIRERNIVGRSMNMMKAHENMTKTDMDFTRLPDGDLPILAAPNVFREREDGSDNILRQKRFSIMQTREAGNNLNFF